MAGIKIVDLPALGRDLASTDLFEMSIGGTASRKITGQEIMNASKLNVGATPIVSGTVGRLLFQGTGNVLQQSSSLFWENTTGRLELTTSADNQVGLLLKSTTGILKVRTYLSGTYGTLIEARNLADSAYTPMSLSGSKLMLLDGNVLINTPSDAGFRLDVNGTARVVNALTLGNVVLSLSSQGGGSISCANSAGANTGSFINLSGPVYLNPTAGNSGMFAITGQYASSSGTANFNHLNLAPTLNTTGTYSGIVRGIYYNPTLTSVTGVTHRAIDLTSGDFVWGTGYSQYYGNSIEGFIQFNTSGSTTQLWMRPAGNQNNYGTSYYSKISHTNADLTINSGQYGSLYLGANGGSGANTSMVLFNAAANTPAYVLINTTTNAGFRLDVNGTARVSGALTVGPLGSGTFLQTQGSTAVWFSDANNPLRITLAQALINLNNSGDFNIFRTMSSARGVISTNPETFNFAVEGYNAVNGIFNRNLSNANKSVFYASTSGGGSVTNAPILRYFHAVKGNVTGYTSYRGVEVEDLDSYFGTTSGSVGIGANTSINASAILDITSTTKGFLPPRMTNAQRTAIVSPAVGLIVYCTDATEGLWVYKSTGWTFIV